MRFLPLFAILFSGCTMIPTQHGTAQFWGDYESLILQDGAVYFAATGMVHSRVAKVHWGGAAAIGAEIATSGIGGAPGAGAAVIPAVVHRPTNRDHSTPRPKTPIIPLTVTRPIATDSVTPKPKKP